MLRYQLHEKLGEGGMGAVFRATDRLTGHEVALKQVLLHPQHLAFNSSSTGSDALVALAHEFQTLASLRHPHIVSVLDYGFDTGQQPFFTMSLLKNPQTILEAGQGLSINGKVELILQLLQAVAYLHRRGILHRDLKPGNVLVTAGTVYVLDFGLAVEPGAATEVAGTLAYMAPEVLQGQPATYATDLFAIGIMAYEMLVGQHPFLTRTVSATVQAIMFETPDFAAADLDPALLQTMNRLLAKNPRDRFPQASAALGAFSAALGQPLPAETSAIRDSFLQAAKFVGREAELTQLTTALHQSLQGRGSGFLIGGESGVGKSRLLDEMRSRALVAGALVVNGQAVAEGGLPYQLWRDPLRRLVLASDVTDLEASILQKIIPDLGTLLGRSIPPAPELAGKSEQQRLITTMLEVFKRPPQPIVLIVEDLQWSDSLEVLQQLAMLLDGLSVLVIGSYRDDEAPRLPDELPTFRAIKLTRLHETEMAELSASMLGEAGRDPQILDLLEKETEGNVFFMVEVIRALAEEAGSLQHVGLRTLPPTVFAEGIQQIVQRRLAKVPSWAYQHLQVAAVAGRALDLEILGTLISTALQDWLLACAEAAILEVHDDHWRFAHDRLREQLLRDIEATRLQRLHRQIAEAIELTYPQDDSYAALLVEHWHKAGESAQERHYAVLAGQAAIKVGAIERAIAYYRRAVALTTEDTQKSHEFALLGEAYRLKGAYDDSANHFEQALMLSADDPLKAARAWCGLAWAQQTRGDFQQSLESATHAESLLRGGDFPDLLAEALYHKGWALFELGNAQAAKALAEEGIALSATVNAHSQMADHLNLLSVVDFAVFGDYEGATRAQQQALTLYRELGDRHGEGIMLNNLGENARVQGKFEAALRLYQAAVDMARTIGDQDGEMVYLSNVYGTQVGLGEYQAAVAGLNDLLMRVPNDWYALSEALRVLAEGYWGLGRPEQAFKTAQRALNAARGPDDVGRARRVLGQVTEGETARTHFAASVELLREIGLGQDEALTLAAWGRFEMGAGNQAEGERLLDAARAIFTRLNLPTWANRV